MDILEFVRKLQEHAYRRKKAISKIEDLQLPIKQHLTKIALFPYHQSIKHWEKEVVNWLYSISEMKIKGKGVLKEKQYFEILYEEPWTPIEAIKQGIKNQIEVNEDLKPCIKNIEEKAKKLEYEAKKFFKEISKDLSSGDFSVKKTKKLLGEFRKTFLEDCND